MIPKVGSYHLMPGCGIGSEDYARLKPRCTLLGCTPPKTNGWRAPKGWALEKGNGTLQKWQCFGINSLDFWSVTTTTTFFSIVLPHTYRTYLRNAEHLTGVEDQILPVKFLNKQYTNVILCKRSPFKVCSHILVTPTHLGFGFAIPHRFASCLSRL